MPSDAMAKYRQAITDAEEHASRAVQSGVVGTAEAAELVHKAERLAYEAYELEVSKEMATQASAVPSDAAAAAAMRLAAIA